MKANWLRRGNVYLTLALQQVPHDIVFVPSVAWQCLISKHFYVHASFCMHSKCKICFFQSHESEIECKI